MDEDDVTPLPDSPIEQLVAEMRRLAVENTRREIELISAAIATADATTLTPLLDLLSRRTSAGQSALEDLGDVTFRFGPIPGVGAGAGAPPPLGGFYNEILDLFRTYMDNLGGTVSGMGPGAPGERAAARAEKRQLSRLMTYYEALSMARTAGREEDIARLEEQIDAIVADLEGTDEEADSAYPRPGPPYRVPAGPHLIEAEEA